MCRSVNIPLQTNNEACNVMCSLPQKSVGPGPLIRFTDILATKMRGPSSV